MGTGRRERQGYDATGPDGTTDQVKAVRLHDLQKSRQVSALRNLPDGHFSMPAGQVFGHGYDILRAALIPHGIVAERTRNSNHTNSGIFHLTDDLWTLDGVQDVTEALRAALT